VLPEGLLPICRAPLPLLKEIADLSQKHFSRPEIQRVTGLTRGVVKRLMKRIISLGEALVTQARADGLLDGKSDPICMVEILRLCTRFPGWTAVTYFLSRRLYPAIWPIGPPEDATTQFGQ
jgi:hypothetical protein